MPPFREPHALEFEAVANFRDLGGHTTRDGARVARGRLFRSGHLGHATEGDVERLEGLGLRRVFDFRNLVDIEAEGADVLPAATEHHRLPMPDPAKGENLRSIIEQTTPEEMRAMFGDGKAAAMMADSAASLVRERREPYREFLTVLSTAGSIPALFHCSAGKDRAGWAGTLVLLTLGVDEEQVVEQYLLSNRAIDHIRERVTTSAPGTPPRKNWGKLMLPFLEVRREYIQASFDAMHADWGSFDAYLYEGLGITEAQRESLRELMLE